DCNPRTGGVSPERVDQLLGGQVQPKFPRMLLLLSITALSLIFGVLVKIATSTSSVVQLAAFGKHFCMTIMFFGILIASSCMIYFLWRLCCFSLRRFSF